MATTIDARGLSCPQPVLLTLEAISAGAEEQLVVLVDTDTSRENVTRAASSRGYESSEVKAEDDGYRLTFTKSRA